MTPSDIRETVKKLDTSSASILEAIWAQLKPMGAEVIPYLAEAYPGFKKWQGRAALVFYATRHARISEPAFQLGLSALNDKATLVRYRACGLLAYSKRKDALPFLKPLTRHEDKKTAEDAKAAMDAIKSDNHHFFHDRDHSGNLAWVVNEGDGDA